MSFWFGNLFDLSLLSMYFFQVLQVFFFLFSRCLFPQCNARKIFSMLALKHVDNPYTCTFVHLNAQFHYVLQLNIFSYLGTQLIFTTNYIFFVHCRPCSELTHTHAFKVTSQCFVFTSFRHFVPFHIRHCQSVFKK